MIPDTLLKLLREVIVREDCPAHYRHCIADYLTTGNDFALSRRYMSQVFGPEAAEELATGPWYFFSNEVYMAAPGTSRPFYKDLGFTEGQATHARKLLPPLP